MPPTVRSAKPKPAAGAFVATDAHARGNVKSIDAGKIERATPNDDSELRGLRSAVGGILDEQRVADGIECVECRDGRADRAVGVGDSRDTG